MPSYDAFLLVSFGGPEGPDEVMPFLENVTRGRGIPAARLAEVAHHYELTGGVSPINQQCRALLTTLGKEFASAGVSLPSYWGNRNWHPFLAETLAAMADDGIRRAIAFVTSAYGSYSSCRQYLDDIERAREQVGPRAPVIDKIRHFCHDGGFIEAFAESTVAALATLPDRGAGAHLAFTAHSVPLTMAAASGPDGGLYEAQLRETARLVAARVEQITGVAHSWRLVYQSRSGPPSVPWLAPDVCDHLATLSAGGCPGVVLVPVGFISDHMEVVYDLDVEAVDVAANLGLPLARAATPGVHPRFVSMIVDLIRERESGAGREPPRTCVRGCCGGADAAGADAAGARGAARGAAR